MDRVERPRTLWVAAALCALAALPLVFANALHGPTAGQNEEINAALFLLALGLAVAGLAVRRSLRGADAKTAAGGVALVVLGALAYVGLVLASVPDFDGVRTLEWEHLEAAPSSAVEVGDALPGALADELLASAPGTPGFSNLPRADYDAMWAAIEARGGRHDVAAGGVAVLVHGEPFRFAHGPVA